MMDGLGYDGWWIRVGGGVNDLINWFKKNLTYYDVEKENNKKLLARANNYMLV